MAVYTSTQHYTGVSRTRAGGGSTEGILNSRQPGGSGEEPAGQTAPRVQAGSLEVMKPPPFNC